MRNIYCRETNCFYYIRRIRDPRSGQMVSKIGMTPGTAAFTQMLASGRTEINDEGDEFDVAQSALWDIGADVVETRQDVYEKIRL